MPNRASLSSVEAKKLLRQSSVKAKKGLGQHFLIDEAVLDTIISAAELSPEDTVIEVGPGLGILTTHLARQAGQVIAVELDTKLAQLLRQKLASSNNVTVVNADILKTNLSQLLDSKDNYKVVANIPYYITSPILRYFMETSSRPSLMVVMVQKEVGEAIAALPGGMSFLAVSLQIYSKPKIVSYVSSRSFYPSPKVDSAIVRLDIFSEPAIKADINGFLDVVKCGFASPRKQLHNSLAQGLNIKPAEAALLLKGAKIEPQRRAETLSIDEWEKLYKAVIASKKDETPC